MRGILRAPLPSCGAAPGPLPDRGRRRLAMAIGASLAAWPLAGTAQTEPTRLRDSRALMGTRVDIAAQCDDRALLRPALDAAFARMAALTAVMSHYSPTSRVAAINLAAGLQPVPVPPELMQVLDMARAVSVRSDGAFDITIGSVGRWHFDTLEPQMPSPAYISSHLPSVDYRKLIVDSRSHTVYLKERGMRIDLGGIAKLYILQAGLETLRAFGVKTALVNGGGDVVAMTERSARPWRVGIRDPRQPERLLATLEVRHGFVASSGDYERWFMRDGRRYHHVLDPRTGYPANGPHGATLVGEELEAVNGIGAAAMVLDPSAGRALIQRTEGVQGLVASRDGGLWITPGLRDRLLPPASALS